MLERKVASNYQNSYIKLYISLFDGPEYFHPLSKIGGIPTTMIDKNCTHVVVENGIVEIPENINVKAKVVKQEVK